MNSTATTLPPTASQLAPGIVAALPGQWTFRPSYGDDNDSRNRYTLTRADGLELGVSTGIYSFKGRIVIRHDAPSGKDRQTPTIYDGRDRVNLYPEITVADSKTPEQIAADVARRLLPEAARVRALVLARIAANEDCQSKTVATVRRIASAAGQVADPYDGRAAHDMERVPEVRLNQFNSYSDHGYGDAAVNNGGETVRIKLESIPTAKAVALIEWLRANVFTG